jgi:hypothetical protein
LPPLRQINSNDEPIRIIPLECKGSLRQKEWSENEHLCACVNLIGMDSKPKESKLERKRQAGCCVLVKAGTHVLAKAGVRMTRSRFSREAKQVVAQKWGRFSLNAFLPKTKSSPYWLFHCLLALEWLQKRQ